MKEFNIMQIFCEFWTYKIDIEGKISDPSEELEDETERASVETKTVTAPNIVFKRPPSDSQPEPDHNESEPPIKKSKFDDIEIGNLQKVFEDRGNSFLSSIFSYRKLRGCSSIF